MVSFRGGCVLGLGLSLVLLPGAIHAFSCQGVLSFVTARHGSTAGRCTTTAVLASAAASSSEESSSATPPVELSKAPGFNGKVVFPLKALAAGLKGHQVAAVYAVLNKSYKRGAGEGWEHCEYVGVTMDLNVALDAHVAEHGTDTVGHIRALSFAYPQKSAMEEVANRWKESVSSSTAGKPLGDWNVPDDTMTDKLKKAVETGAEAYLFADDDDDDDDDDEFEEFEDVVKETVVDRSMGLLADFAGSMKKAETAEAPPREEAVISPFADGGALMNGQVLPFSKENVDKILDEVRPYLISDGGNVSVQRVVDETRDVYLVLEGACGSCASSTVTMKMGIERVLKENFPDLGQVLQVEDDAGADSNPTELTWEAVNMEVNRIKPAIVAMGGVIEILKVEPIGVVELRFRGSNKVQQGLELALRDVPFVKHVNFVSQ